MELKVVNRTEKSLEVEFVGERDTLLNLLKVRLLQDPKVEVATYVTEHPILAHPRLVLHVKSGRPEAALKSAAAGLRKELDGFEDAFLKALQ